MRTTVLSLVLLTACSAYDDLGLLEVESIEPPEIEPGTTLRIHGHGFPLGRAPAITLRGSVHRPGEAVVAMEASFEGTVRSESLIEVPMGPELIDAIGGRATVDGELRVGFPAADRHREVFAAERIRLDLLPETATQLRADGAPEERERIHAEGFGLRLSREELGTVGVRVESVEPKSLAARQGMKPGDTVVGLDGISIYGWRDFVPDPSRTESTVLVSREGLRGVHALRWPHEATERRSEPLSLVVFVLLGLLLGWSSPVALCLGPRFVRAPRSVWLLRGSLLLVFAALLSLVPALQWTTMWILALGTFAALFALATRERIGTTSFALTVGATLTIMLIAKTASITEIVGAQGPELLRWYLFQSPATSLAFVAYVVAVGSICRTPRISAALFTAAAAVLGGALFLGGWPLGGPAVAIPILGAKAMVLLLAAHALQLSSKVASGVALAGLGLALVGLFVDLGALFPQWSALASGAFCAIAARAVVPPLRRTGAPLPA
jgi:hypothetical protein